MPTTWEIVHAVLVFAAAVSLVVVVRWRHRSHRRFLRQYSDEAVCPHLRPAYEMLLQRGHVIVRAGQRNPDMPVEIHMAPKFDPRQVFHQCALGEPAAVSERNVLYCPEDWVELRPVDG